MSTTNDWNTLRTDFPAPLLVKGDYDPKNLIREVNKLQPLGKEKVLEVIEGYDNFYKDSDPNVDKLVLYLLLRVLFDIPTTAGYFPNLGVGRATPSPPKDPTIFPRFPVLLVGGIPLLITHSFELFGVAIPVRFHLDYCRKHCELRSQVLIPTTHPLGLLAEIEKLPEWSVFLADAEWTMNADLMKVRLMNQLLLCVRSLLPELKEEWFPYYVDVTEDYEAEWLAYQKALPPPYRMEWDLQSSDYRVVRFPG